MRAASRWLAATSERVRGDGCFLNLDRSYITRMRRKSVPALRPAPTIDNESVAQTRDAGRDARLAESDREKPFDPLANIRERQGKRTGFDYQPYLGDPKDLI